MRRRPAPDEPIRFLGWILKNKFSLMESHLQDLKRPAKERDPERLERAFLRATRHAKRVLAVRLAIIILIALSAGGSLVSGAIRAVSDVPGVQETFGFLIYVGSLLFALSGVIFLAINRYLSLVEVSANYLAMQLATVSAQPRKPKKPA